jgi:hypothetical protein
MTKPILALAGIGFMLFAPAAFSNLIQNGSFESPVLSSGAVQQVTPTAWTWTGNPGFIFNTIGGVSLVAQHGDQFVDIGNTSAFSLKQDFSIVNTGVYELTWYDNATAFFQVAPYSVTVIGGGTPSTQYDSNEGVDGVWNSRSLRLNLIAGDYTLAFAPLDIPGPLPAQDRFIDNVSLGAVPIPGSVWLMSTALACLSGFSLKRRRSTDIR